MQLHVIECCHGRTHLQLCWPQLSEVLLPGELLSWQCLQVSSDALYASFPSDAFCKSSTPETFLKAWKRSEYEVAEQQALTSNRTAPRVVHMFGD